MAYRALAHAHTNELPIDLFFGHLINEYKWLKVLPPNKLFVFINHNLVTVGIQTYSFNLYSVLWILRSNNAASAYLRVAHPRHAGTKWDEDR